MTIPFFKDSTPTGSGAAPAGGLFRIALPLAAGIPATGALPAAAGLAGKESARTLAIWVAAALVNPKKALQVARLKREDKLDEADDFDKADVASVRDAVRAAQDDESIKPEITEDVKTAAGSVNADARLVAVAVNDLTADKARASEVAAAASGLAITVLDSTIATNAARVAATLAAKELLNEGDDVASLRKRLAALEAFEQAAKARLDALEEEELEEELEESRKLRR